MSTVERFIFTKREGGMYEARLSECAPENTQERSIYLGLVVGRSKHWVPESVHSKVRSLGKFKTREQAAERLLALGEEQGRVQ